MNSPSLHFFCQVSSPLIRKVTYNLPIVCSLILCAESHQTLFEVIWYTVIGSKEPYFFQVCIWICKDRQWTMIKHKRTLYTAWKLYATCNKENRDIWVNERAFWRKVDLSVRLREKAQPPLQDEGKQGCHLDELLSLDDPWDRDNRSRTN